MDVKESAEFTLKGDRNMTFQYLFGVMQVAFVLSFGAMLISIRCLGIVRNYTQRRQENSN